MNYPDGTDARLGDRVRLSDGASGVVVCSIDADTYSEGHPRAQWSYLESGVMIDFDRYGLIHFIVADPDLELVQRGEIQRER